MKIPFCIILTTAILTSMAVECLSADGRVHLKNGLKAYREEADFDKSISELQKAVQLGLDDRKDLSQAYLYMGFAYIGKGQRMAAEVEFSKAVKLDSTLRLDPKFHSTKIITVFNEVKARLVDSLTIVSIPGGAKVYLDSTGSDLKATLAGTTPLKLDEVLIGEHTLRIVKEYFQPAVLNIRVEKGKNNRVRVQLDKKEFELLITSQPPEAVIYLAGKKGFQDRPHGKIPLSLKMVLDQELAFKLAKEEFLDKELKVKLTEGGFRISDVENVIPLEKGVGSVCVRLDSAPPPGVLHVVSDPLGAMVYLDGITMGLTPLTIAKVTPGVRRVRVSMSGFNSVTREIEVMSGEKVAVDVVMGGQLNVLSMPGGAQVFINEEFTGGTPLKTGRIPAGSYQLRLTKEKHKDKHRAVVVERGQTKEVSIRLLPIKGSISVSSDPSGAAVYLNGEKKGNTPLLIYGVMIGQSSLKLVKTGCEVWEKQITVEELKVSWHFGKLKKN